VLCVQENVPIISLKYSPDKLEQNNQEGPGGILISVEKEDVYRVFSCKNGKYKNTHAILIPEDFRLDWSIFVHVDRYLRLLISNHAQCIVHELGDNIVDEIFA